MPCDLGSLVTLERPGRAWMEPIEGVEPSTYHLQGDCSASWAISAYNTASIGTRSGFPVATGEDTVLSSLRYWRLPFHRRGSLDYTEALSVMVFPSKGGLPSTPYVSEPFIGSSVRFSLTATRCRRLLICPRSIDSFSVLTKTVVR